MARQNINRGAFPDDPSAENLYVTFGKVINNFNDFYNFQTAIGSTANGDGASLVAIEDVAANFTSTDVEGALAELASSLGVVDHGALTGLGDDDHAQYVLVNGTRGIAATGTTNLNIDHNGTGWIRLQQSGGGDIIINPSGGGEPVIAGIAYPKDNGIAGQALTTDAAGNADWGWMDGRYYTETELGSVAALEGASLIGINDSLGYYSGGSVESALQEIGVWQNLILPGTSAGQGASLVGVQDSAANFVGADVETVLAEIATDTKISTSAPSDSISQTFDSIISTTIELPTNSGSVRLYALEDCLIKFGDINVVIDPSTSIYFAKGTEILGTPSGATHIAVKGVGNNGALNISGLDTVYKTQLTTNKVLPYTAGSSNIALPSGSSVRLFSTTDCQIEFGDNLVSANSNSLFFAAGTEYINIPSGAMYIAAIRYSVDGGLYITGAN